MPCFCFGHNRIIWGIPEDWLLSPRRLVTMVTRPVPAPSSMMLLSIRLYSSRWVSRKWHRTMACEQRAVSVLLRLRLKHVRSDTHRGPQNGPVTVRRLRDFDLHVCELISFPRFGSDQRRTKVSLHDRLCQLSVCKHTQISHLYCFYAFILCS